MRSQKVQDGGQLFRCATRLATDAKYAAQKTDSVRTSRISCDGTSCQRADLAESRSPLDEKLAQTTLHLAGWATAAERGWAQRAVLVAGDFAALGNFDAGGEHFGSIGGGEGACEAADGAAGKQFREANHSLEFGLMSVQSLRKTVRALGMLGGVLARSASFMS